MAFGTRLHTYFFGKLVGEDEFGNRYYEEKQLATGAPRKRRWVVYKGINEPSKVPPSWHIWLHYMTNLLPSERMHTSYAWEKSHVPNLSGTPLAYHPPGHILNGGQREDATGDYEAWIP